MGCGPFYGRVSSSPTVVERFVERVVEKVVRVRVRDPRNPDPMNFKVVNVKRVGEVFVSWINYPNCTNYEGNKIIVTRFDPRTTKTLDPHFNKKSTLIARFVPTEEGWDLAMAFAGMMKNHKEQNDNLSYDKSGLTTSP